MVAFVELSIPSGLVTPGTIHNGIRLSRVDTPRQIYLDIKARYSLVGACRRRVQGLLRSAP